MGHPQVHFWCGVGAETQEGGIKPPLHRRVQNQAGNTSAKNKGVAHAQEFVRFGGGDAGVGGEAVEMVEALAGGP